MNRCLQTEELIDAERAKAIPAKQSRNIKPRMIIGGREQNGNPAV
jgi:hypothetical protein